MAVFYPSKSGDAMGKPAFSRFNKQQKREFAENKALEEERRDGQNYYKTKRAAESYREVVKAQRKAAGLDG